MTLFNQAEFNEFVLQNNVIGFFEQPIKLKSGRRSNWYVNWRDIAEDVKRMDQLSDYVISFVRDTTLEPDCFYGVPEGATKLGIITQFKWAKSQIGYGEGTHCLPMGRARPKDHGAAKDKYFVGIPRGKVIVLEDVTTTGGSLLETIDALTESEIQVIAAIGLTNRMEKRDDGMSVEEAVKGKGVSYFSLTDAFQVLPKAYDKLKPGDAIADAVEKEFIEYGVKRLRLE
ncbi:MAG: hypothetical protein V2A62_02055 [Candidatus Woesearchaeota archaeon]